MLDGVVLEDQNIFRPAAGMRNLNITPSIFDLENLGFVARSGEKTSTRLNQMGGYMCPHREGYTASGQHFRFTAC